MIDVEDAAAMDDGESLGRGVEKLLEEGAAAAKLLVEAGAVGDGEEQGGGAAVKLHREAGAAHAGGLAGAGEQKTLKCGGGVDVSGRAEEHLLDGGGVAGDGVGGEAGGGVAVDDNAILTDEREAGQRLEQGETLRGAFNRGFLIGGGPRIREGQHVAISYGSYGNLSARRRSSERGERPR